MLSDTEPIPEDTVQSNVEIVEVSEPTGEFLKIFNNTHTFQNMHTLVFYTRITNTVLELRQFSQIRV